MKFIPILFSTEMVQAILEGRKRMTRRVLKVKGCKPFIPDNSWDIATISKWNKDYHPYGNPNAIYNKGIWKPSIHMPKEACRLFLQIKDIRVERLQDISEEDAKAEGIKYVIDKLTGYCGFDYINDGYNLMTTPFNGFRSLWKKINGFQSWDDNPWVWVIEFEKIEKPENFIKNNY